MPGECFFFFFFTRYPQTIMVQTPAKRTEMHIAMVAEAVEAGQEQLSRPGVSVSALLMSLMRAKQMEAHLIDTVFKQYKSSSRVLRAGMK